MAMSVSQRAASRSNLRPLSSPAERFTSADAALTAATGVAEALLVRTRKTPAGRFWWPVIVGLVSVPFAIETQGYTRAVSVGVLAVSSGLVAIEAKDSLT